MFQSESARFLIDMGLLPQQQSCQLPVYFYLMFGQTFPDAIFVKNKSTVVIVKIVFSQD
jgi:hypothetical protein